MAEDRTDPRGPWRAPVASRAVHPGHPADRPAVHAAGHVGRCAALLSATLLGLLAATQAACQGAPPATGGASLVERLCEPAYGPGWPLLEGPQNPPLVSVPKPRKGEAWVDPAARTCTLRATDHAAETAQGNRGFLRNDYSRRQAFNADGSRFFVSASNGSWWLYDANTLALLHKLPGVSGDAEPQWHPSRPELLYFLPNNGLGMKLYELDLRSGRERVVGDFGSRLKARWPEAATAWTKSEGSPSADGRHWCFMVDDREWRGVGLFVWDMAEDRIVAMRDLKHRPDHVSMSPSGNFCVLSGDSSGGTWAYPRDLSDPRRLHRKSEHSDLALDARGDDVYVSVDYDARGGPLFMVKLRTGERTELVDTYVAGTATALHVSGKAYDKPGWVLVSTYADYEARGRAGSQWLHRKLFAIELKPRPRIVQLGQHHSVHAKYWSEPQATVSRDFSRVLFNSNWEMKSETDIDAWLMVLPLALRERLTR